MVKFRISSTRGVYRVRKYVNGQGTVLGTFTTKPEAEAFVRLCRKIEAQKEENR